MALRARAVLGGDYIDRKTVDVNVNLGSPAGMWTIRAEDLAALTEAQKEQLKAVMFVIRDHRRHMAKLPSPAVELTPVEVIEAEIAEEIEG